MRKIGNVLERNLQVCVMILVIMVVIVERVFVLGTIFFVEPMIMPRSIRRDRVRTGSALYPPGPAIF